MSRIGGDPFANSNVGINPMYTSRADNARATQAATGTVGGHTVQMAPAATAPAHSSGIGDKIKSFFNAMGKGIADAFRSGVEAFQGLFTRAPQAQAPAAAPQAQAAAPAPRPQDPEVVRLKGTLPYKLFGEHADFNPKSLGTADRAACSYAFVREQANKAAVDPSSFMRSNSNGSKLTAMSGAGPESKAIMEDLIAIIDDKQVGVTDKAFGMVMTKEGQVVVGSTYDPKLSPFPAMKDLTPGTPAYATARADLISDSLDVVERCMREAFGTPGDDASVNAAAQRLPQSLCDQIGILFKAIDDSDASPELKGQLKMHAARDAVALRCVLPQGTVVASAIDADENKRVFDLNKGKPSDQQIRFERSVPAASLMEVTKAMQSLVNGVGFGAKDAEPDVVKAGAGMKDRWNDAFSDFVAVVMARADQTVVNAAAQDGGSFHADFKAAKEEIATRQAA